MKVYAIIAVIFFVLGNGVAFKLSKNWYTSEFYQADVAAGGSEFYGEPQALADASAACSSPAHKNTPSNTLYRLAAAQKNEKNASTPSDETVNVLGSTQINDALVKHLEDGQALSASQWQAIKGSPQAASSLLALFNNTFDSKQREKLSVMMRNLPKNEKIALSSQLINAADEEERRLAYSLLRRTSTTSLPDNLAESVAYNLYQEGSSSALVDNLSVVRRLSSEQVQNHGVLSHVNQLTRHQDAQVRAQAIDTLSYLNNSRDTLGLVMQGLQDNSPEVRQAAATALFNYDQIDESNYNLLLEISGDFSEDNKVREEILAYLSDSGRG